MSDPSLPEELAQQASRRPLSPIAARRVFLTLTTTRWLPIGFVVGILVLWMLERGLTLPQTLTAMSVIGFVVLALELPTSGFADAVGPDRVIAATDCGLGGRVHPQIAWAKLEALAQGAELASRRLSVA